MPDKVKGPTFKIPNCELSLNIEKVEVVLLEDRWLSVRHKGEEILRVRNNVHLRGDNDLAL